MANPKTPALPLQLERAISSMYAPPTTPVAITLRVSRYNQKVSANHR